MNHKNDFERFQDQIFQEMDEGNRLHVGTVAARLVDIAHAAGYSIDDLIGMMDGGILKDDITTLVFEKYKTMKRQFSN